MGRLRAKLGQSCNGVAFDPHLCPTRSSLSIEDILVKCNGWCVPVEYFKVETSAFAILCYCAENAEEGGANLVVAVFLQDEEIF